MARRKMLARRAADGNGGGTLGLQAGLGQGGTWYPWVHTDDPRPNNPAGDPAFNLLLSSDGDVEQVDLGWDSTGWRIQMGGSTGDTRGLYVQLNAIGLGGYLWPGSWFQNFASVNPGVDWTAVNRLAFLVKLDTDFAFGANYIGTYTKAHDSPNTGQGDHFYHANEHAFVANKWVLVIMNRTPNHQVGDSDNGRNYGDDPSWNGFATSDWGQVHYFDGLTRFYYTIYTTTSPSPGSLTGGIATIKGFDYGIVTGEDDAEIYTLSGDYDGTQYNVNWSGIKQASRTYEIRYSTTGSLHTAGFDTGTDGGTTMNPATDYIKCRWSSGAMAESATGMWIAIRRVGQTTLFTEIYIPYHMGA
jgi:hypothetical protein